MRSARHSAGGFSLVEVIIAVGIFAATVAVMLGLLAPLTRQAAGSAHALVALGLPDAIRVELRRLATAGGFGALAGQARPMSAPLPPTLTLVAPADGSWVQSLSYLPPADAGRAGDRFFAVEAWTFNQGPLAFDPGGAVLALHVRVSWPYFAPGAAVATPLADREQVTFNLSLTR